jgi:hypothetical protein
MSQPGPSSAKRQRIAQACDQCRKRKSKCGGELPACLVCVSTARTCIYKSSPRKRGLQPGYVRNLETLLGLFVREIPAGAQRIRVLLRSPEVVGNAFENDATEGAVEAWRKSALCKDLELVLATSEDKLEGSGNPLSPVTIQDDTDEPRQYPTAAEEYPLAPRAAKVTARQDQGHDICNGRLPPQTSDLVELYFAHTHPWFPILERRDVLRIMHSETPTETLSSSADGFRACVWAIVALTTSQSHSLVKGVAASVHILASLRSQMTAHDQEPGLGHIQARLLLVLLRMAWGQFNAAWVLVAEAARMLLIYQQRPPRYAHTFRGCVMLDNFLSVILGKASLFPSSNQVEYHQLDEDSVEEWEPWNGPFDSTSQDATRIKTPTRALSIFNLISRLMGHLARITLHSLDDQTHQVYIDDLQNFKAELPAYCTLNDIGCSSPALLNLHLMWNFVVCTLWMKSRSVDKIVVDSVVQTTATTLSILNELTRRESATSSLLLGFAVQANNCLQGLGQANLDGIARSLLVQLDELQVNLKSRWQLKDTDDDETLQGMHCDSVPEMVGTEIARVAIAPKTHAQLPQQVLMLDTLTGGIRDFNKKILPVSTQGDATGQIPQVSDYRPGLSVALDAGREATSSAMSGWDQFDDVNDFDALLEDMVPLLPLKR